MMTHYVGDSCDPPHPPMQDSQKPSATLQESKRRDVTYLCSRQAVEDESWIGEHDDWFGEAEGTNHYQPTNDLSANVKLVDAVLAAAKRAGLILVDEVSGVTIPDASETIRRYLDAPQEKP